ncbi:MAG: hypothetical protein R2822_23160 [Spirosomataceae bacterium]
MINDGAELSESEQLTQEGVAAMEELEMAEEQAIDYSQLSKKDLVGLLENQLAIAKGENVKSADFKRSDELLKEIKVVFDQIKKTEREEAKQRYIAENESEEGFEYKTDDQTQLFDSLYRQIKEIKHHYFQHLEKSKDKNFSTKTQLLQSLRELVDADESNAKNPAISWQEFKKFRMIGKQRAIWLRPIMGRFGLPTMLW